MNFFRHYKTFDEILPSFLADIKMQIGAKSYLSYTGKTKVFSDWLEHNKLNLIQLNKLTSQNISDFFVYLATRKNLDKPTCQKYSLTIRKVFLFAQKRDEVADIPFDLVTYPKKGKDMSARVISPEHSKILLEDIKQHDKQLYLATMMEYFCFIRPGTELRLMKVGDLDFGNGTIRVTSEHAKNGHQRIVTMPDQFIEIAKEQGLDKIDRNLFIFGKHYKPGEVPWSVNMLDYHFNKFRNKHNLPKEYKLYSWKHNGATGLHRSGAPLIDTMIQLGHSSLSASQHYIHKHMETVNNGIKKNFPNPY